jgi:hypothetical protein
MAIPDSQRCSLLCAEADARRSASAIAKYLRTNQLRWDVLDLDYLGDDVRTSALEDGFRVAGFHPLRRTGQTFLCISLREPWGTYYARRTRRLKKGNNLIANRLHKNFAVVSVERIDNRGDDAAFARIVSDYVRLSADSWKKGTGTTLDEPGPAAWLTELCRATAGTGQIAIWRLLLDGRTAAAELQLDFHGIVSALRADVNVEFEPHAPGTYLNWKVLEGLHGSGRSLYNMGPGKNPYKLRWAESEATLVRITAFNRSLRGQVARYWETSIKPRLQRTHAAWLARRHPSSPDSDEGESS